MKKFISILILLSIVIFSTGQNQYHQIKISLEGLKDTTVYLATYYGSKVLKSDSVRLDQNGNGVFEGEKELSPGLYLIYLNDQNFFDFLLGSDQQLRITASFQRGIKHKITGAKETEAFQQYQEFLAKQRGRQTKIQTELRKAKERSSSHNGSQIQDSVKVLTREMEVLNKEMEQYWETKSAEFKGTFFADFLRTMIPAKPKASETAPVNASDSLRWAKSYAFNRDHFWDNFNFNQPGLIHTPILENRIETYFKNILLPMPDSVLNPTLRLIERSKVNEEMFRYIALNRLNSALKSEVMGMDKVFIGIAEHYFLKENLKWLDSTSKAKIIEKIYVTKSNLLGNPAPDLKLPDSEGNYYRLRQMNGDYTILYFWEPGCSHCQKITPILNEKLFEPLKNKGVNIFAVYTQTNKEEWLKGISQYKLFEWTNVWDPNQDSNFRVLYDVFSTPVIYVLDKSKHIIAKRIDVETAVKFIEEDMKRRESAIGCRL